MATINAPARYSQRLEMLSQIFSTSFHLVHPRSLNGFQHLLAAAAVIVIEPVEIDDKVMQVDKAHLARVDIRMFLYQCDRDVAHVYPFHLLCPSFAMLMVYLGISITISSLPTIAWQLSRELDSSPQALSSSSSSWSVASTRLLKPSRTMT